MYLAHFGLGCAPFALTPDTAFSFPSHGQREALDALVAAFQAGEGFVEITGEVGTGKTLLCRRFLAHLAGAGAGCRAAHIPNPCLSPRTLLLSIARELRVDVADANSDAGILHALHGALLDPARRGSRVVLCLDEAQAMPVETLEALRLLSNPDSGGHSAVQVVLFGQHELDHKLARHELRALRTRIACRHELGALSGAETGAYLAHRLRVAGHPAGDLFVPDVARAMQFYTGGVPRLLNIIGHKSLLLACAQGCPHVLRGHVRAAALETPRVVGPGLLARLLRPRWLRA